MINDVILHILARAGGGGSSGGGGGGGGGFSGGSSSSGGSGGGDGWFTLAFLAGYLPISILYGQFKRRDKRGVGRMVSLLLTALIAGGVATFSGVYAVISVLGAAIGFISGSASLHSRTAHGVAKAAKAAKSKLTSAASKDKAWDEAALRKHVAQTFMAYQADWSSFNMANMQRYLAADYFAHMQLVLSALKAMGRQNIVENPQLISAEFVDVDDEPNNVQDNFTVHVQAQATDKLLDMRDNNREVYTDNASWSERWRFQRDGSNWRLAKIYQDTESVDARTATLVNFARAQGYFYNADFGWLLLPSRGQLFSNATFKNSDVNNHVIGVFKKCIVEFYSYRPTKTGQETYVIAQAILPKTYGNIVVRQRKGRWSRKLKGLNAISMEAREFNDKYEVYADNVEQVTSFELLHPAFMVKLIDLPYEVNIEVTDNVLYLYATDPAVSYESMQEVLKEAFDELKL